MHAARRVADQRGLGQHHRLDRLQLIVLAARFRCCNVVSTRQLQSRPIHQWFHCHRIALQHQQIAGEKSPLRAGDVTAVLLADDRSDRYIVFAERFQIADGLAHQRRICRQEYLDGVVPDRETFFRGRLAAAVGQQPPAETQESDRQQ
jgi:hypothetical protein